MKLNLEIEKFLEKYVSELENKINFIENSSKETSQSFFLTELEEMKNFHNIIINKIKEFTSDPLYSQIDESTKSCLEEIYEKTKFYMSLNSFLQVINNSFTNEKKSRKLRARIK